MTERTMCMHCEATPATVAASWSVAPTAVDDGKWLARLLCDDCACDLRSASKRPRTDILGVSIVPL